MEILDPVSPNPVVSAKGGWCKERGKEVESLWNVKLLAKIVVARSCFSVTVGREVLSSCGGLALTDCVEETGRNFRAEISLGILPLTTVRPRSCPRCSGH